MISKYSDLNKFGGETWHIKIDALFHIFILNTNQNYFLVELKEWRFFNYKVRKSYISSNDFEITVINAFNNLQEYLNDTGKYYWTDNQKEKKLNLILDFVKDFNKSKTKKTEQKNYENALKQMLNSDNKFASKKHPESNTINNENINSIEYLTTEALKALEKNDNESARVYAEKAYQFDKNNIDVSLIYWSTLIKKIENPSIHKLETNLNKAIALYEEIRNKKSNGLFLFNEKHNEKYSELADEQWEFHQYVEYTKSRIKNNLY